MRVSIVGSPHSAHVTDACTRAIGGIATTVTNQAQDILAGSVGDSGVGSSPGGDRRDRLRGGYARDLFGITRRSLPTAGIAPGTSVTSTRPGACMSPAGSRS